MNELLSSLLGVTAAPVNPNGEVPQAPAPDVNQDPIKVQAQGDTWHPHKRTVLGTVADFMLAAMGLPVFPFGHKNRNQNVNEAMAGFTNNPLKSITRLSKIKGEEGNAATLYDKYIDNQRQDANLDRQNELLEFKKKSAIFDRAANMMGAVKDANSWSAMRNQAMRMGDAYGVDLNEIIPPDYNLDAINTIRAGAVPVAKQMTIDETVRNHDLQHGDRQEGHSIQRDRNEILRQQGNTRLDISQQNADSSAKNADTNRMREEKTPNKTATKQSFVYKMKNGYQLTVVPQPDGSYTAYDHEGNAYQYVDAGNGNLVPTHKKSTSSK